MFSSSVEWRCRLLRAAQFCAGALFALLSACGGGGDSAPATTATQLSPAPTAATGSASIASFSPTAGAPGSVVTVSGTALNTVTSVRIGGVDASFRTVSENAIEATVPSGASTGPIELNASGHVALSQADFTVMAVPVVTSVTPTTVLPPGRVTLTGTSLDAVREVRLNTLVLGIASRTPTSLVLDIPNGAASGTLTLVDNSGIARPLAQILMVSGPLSISSFAPTTIVTGQTLTVTGSNLDRSMSIAFANGATATIASRTGTTRVTAVVPDAAGSGVFRILGNANDEVLSATSLQVIPAIRVDANTVYRVTAAGDRVTMTGTGLTEVAVVRVGAATATIISKAATQLVFAAPASLACGAITLESTSQPSVPGGSLVVGAGCVATVAGVEFAQVLSQGPTDTQLRLVPGKETWVRAYVVSAQTSVPAPLVRLTGYNGAAILGTVDMAGPAVLPVMSGAVVPDALRYSESQSFNVELPAAWVRSGLSVRVEADPLRQLGAPVVVDATPSLGTGTRVEIVLVPVISGGFTPTMPTAAAVLDEVTRRFPIPRANVTVTMRQPYSLSSVTDGLDSSTDWINALSELNQLRTLESGSNATRFYFGFVRRSGGSIAGIGYVPGRTALGWDSNSGWLRTMSHELGHNLSRPHAPCGGVASPDPNYPYAGGILSATPLMDSVPAAIDIVSPSGLADIMGYCNGSWFSDYNYREMQRYMESQSSLVATQIAADGVEQDLLLIAGTLGLDGMQLQPVQAMRGVASIGTGEYTLRLVTRDGSAIEHAFEADLVDHADPPERQFAVLVPNPGVTLARVEVLRGSIPVPPRASALAAQRAAGSSIARLRGVDWAESSGTLRVQWDTAAASSVAVTYIADGKRTVLGVNRAGGTAEFDVSQLPAGGRFEIALSDGLNARTVQVRR